MSSNATIHAALLKAQQDMGPLLKDSRNPHFQSKFASLAAVVETIAEPLQKNGLVVYQTVDVTDNGPVLVTTVANETGEVITSRYPLMSKDPADPQKLGAAVTYARRYALQAMFLLAPEDDDGNLAATPAPAQAQSYQQAPSYPPGVRSTGEKTFRASPNKPASVKQKDMIKGLIAKLGVRNDTQEKKFLQSWIGQDTLEGLSSAQASDLINQLKNQIENPQDEPDTSSVPF